MLIDGFCKNGYLNKAIHILKEAECQKADLDVFAYSSMINGFCKEGRLYEAFAVVGQMEKRGHVLNSHVFNSLIEGFIRASKLKDAGNEHSGQVSYSCLLQYSHKWFMQSRKIQ